MAMSPTCYNHPEKRGDFICFDCKPDSVVNLCPQCNIQVHSLDIFRAHKVEHIGIKGPERRLSQDVSDIEKLIAVENDILQNVLIKLKYTEQEEKETQCQLIQLQTATKKRIAEMKDCEGKIEKAINYLAKVSSMLVHCSSPVDAPDGEVSQDLSTSGPVDQQSEDDFKDPFEQPSDGALLQPPEDLQTGPTEKPIIELPDVLKGKDVFPVCVVGSLSRNGSFWICKAGESEVGKQKKLHADLTNHFQKRGFGDKVEVKEGALCVAFNRHLKEFCRVRIERVLSPSEVRLCFLDVGNTEDASVSVLCKLPKEFEEAPFQALECCLFPDLDTQLPYEAKWCFKDLTYNKVLLAAIESQVTAKSGHMAHHVTLVSCGEVPVCINSKVAATVEEQKLAKEEPPVQPKAELEKQPATNGEAPSPSAVSAIETVHIPPLESNVEVDGVDTSNKNQQVVNPESGQIIASKANSSGNDIGSQNDDAGQSAHALRVDAAEFVPVVPESESQDKRPLQAQVPSQPVNVPGILHLPEQNRTAVTFPEPEGRCPEPIAHLPVGVVDFATYNKILTKCSLNLITEEDMPKARFCMIKSDARRIVEAMKYDIWCSTPQNNRKLNRSFDLASKGGGSVFLLFSGIRSPFFCGVARMKTVVDPNGNSHLLNEPFKFGNKMVGRCEIEWVFTSNLYFTDVLKPESGFKRNHFLDTFDCSEVPNRLGQLIIKAFDSVEYFCSILQEALEAYQPQLIRQQASKAGPVWTPPEWQNTASPVAQENWDEEIEANLKAAKSMEPEQLDEKSPQQGQNDKEAVDSDTFRASVGAASSVSDTSPVFDAHSPTLGDSSLHGIESSEQTNPGEYKAAVLEKRSGEEVHEDSLKSIGTDQAVCGRGNVPEKAEDEMQDPAIPGATVPVEVEPIAQVALPNSREAEVELSVPVEQRQDEQGGDLSCGLGSGEWSDWEGTSPTRICQADETSVLTNTETESTESLGVNVHVSHGVASGQPASDTTDHSRTSEDSLQVMRTVDRNPENSEIEDAVSDVLHDLISDQEDSKQEMQHHVQSEDHHGLHVDSYWEPESEENTTVSLNSMSVEEPRSYYSCDGQVDGQPLDEAKTTSCGEVLDDQGSARTGPAPSQANDYVEIPTEDTGAFLGVKGDSTATFVSEVKPSSSLAHEPVSHEGHFAGTDHEDLLDYSDFPVEKGKEHSLIALENLPTDTGTFWARVLRNRVQDKAFVDVMRQIRASIEANDKPLAADEVHIYKHCCLRSKDEHWHRGLVEKIRDNGMILVRLIDLGECWDVSICDLRPLADEFYFALPPQAFECSVFYGNEDKRENGDKRKERKQKVQRMVKKNRKLRVLVKSFRGSTVEVQVLSNPRD